MWLRLEHKFSRSRIQTQLASRMGVDGASGEKGRQPESLSLPGRRRAWHLRTVVSEKISRDQRRYDSRAGQYTRATHHGRAARGEVSRRCLYQWTDDGLRSFVSSENIGQRAFGYDPS